MRVALTGGPGAGKTALLETLRARGYPVLPEVARRIIAQRKAKGLSPRPPPAEFARLILVQDIHQYNRAPLDRAPTFFDRGMVDSMSMLAQLDLLAPEDRDRLLAQYPYHSTAFILPPWREIYRSDAERDQTFGEAVAVYQSLRDWYLQCGYTLVEVPKGSLDERCDFVLQRLRGESG